MWLVNRLLAAAFGLALAAAGAVTIVESIRFLLGNPPWIVPLEVWGAELARLRWDDQATVLTSTVLSAVGLLLVVSQIVPRLPASFELAGSTPGRSLAIDRRGLEQRLRHTALGHRQVDDARVRVRRRTVAVRAGVSHDTDAGEVRTQLVRGLEETLDATGLQRRLRASIRIHRDKARVA